MLKRVQKSFENTDGLSKYNECLTNKPCLLGMIPLGDPIHEVSIKEFKGYINLFMYLLQIRGYDAIDSNYDINDVPFDLLLYTDEDAENDEIDKIISNSIPVNNIAEAKKKMRNINIISYCNGNYRTSHILKKLFVRLLDKGYSDEETKQILSQVFVLQIVDNYRSSFDTISEIPYATIVTVHDIFDLQNTDYYEEEEELNKKNQTMFDMNPFVHLEKHDNSDRRIIYKSFGKGSLAQRKDTHLFNVDYAKAPIINYIISLYLIKALHMSLEHIEINNNISLQDKIESITQKALSFIKQKNKNYDKFTENDLRELNEFLIHDIQAEFKKNIPVKVLSDDEKEYLYEREEGIQLFLAANQNLNLYTMLYNIIYDLRAIYVMHNNDREKNSEIIKETIAHNIRNLKISYSNFIECINKVIIPEELTPRIHQELTDYLTTMLERAKNSVTDSKFLQILDEYGDTESKKIFGF